MTATRARTLALWIGWLGAMLAVALLLATRRATIDQVHVVLPLLLVVLGGSATGGRALGLALAVWGFVLLDVLFQVPYGTLSVHKQLDWLVLLSFVLTAGVATQLLTMARAEAAAARRRTAEVQRLADLGAETLSAGRAEEALQGIAAVIGRTLRLDACEVYDRGDDGVVRRVASSDDATHADAAAIAARVAAALAERAPNGAAALDDVEAALARALAPTPSDVVLPLRARGGRGAVGALRLVCAGGLRLDAAELTFLAALTHYAALAVERVHLVAEAEHAGALREADRLKDMVLATVSHDLRTPLTTIKALASESARRGDANAAIVEEQADRLGRMVAELLDLSRARTGSIPLALELNTAEDVVGATLRQLGGVLAGRRVVTAVDEEPDGGPLVGRFDFVATLRVLGNLLENAAKYAPAGAPIELDVRRVGDRLAFAVRDRGPGIPEAEQERIFTPFHRAPGAPADVGGAGLGLAVARALAEAQGGTLRVASREGGGSVFTLHVPAVDAQELARAAHALTPTAVEPGEPAR